MDKENAMRRNKDRKARSAGVQSERSETVEMDAIATNADETAPTDDHAFLPADIQSRIGEQLRALYNQIVEEPVPDHLVKLLKRLESKE